MSVTNRLTGRLPAVYPDVHAVHARLSRHFAGDFADQIEQLSPLGRVEIFNPLDVTHRHHKLVAFRRRESVRER